MGVPVRHSLVDTMTKTKMKTQERNTAILAVIVLIVTLAKVGYSTFPYFSQILQNTDSTASSNTSQEIKKKKNQKQSSFFISHHFLHNELRLGADVVAMPNLHQFKAEMNLDAELNPFMVGKIIGIIDEA